MNEQINRCRRINQIHQNLGNWHKYSSDQKEFIDCVNNQPTAFDLDKVVEQLEKEESKATLRLMEDRKTAFEFSSKCRLKAYKKAIKIVKDGGVE